MSETTAEDLLQLHNVLSSLPFFVVNTQQKLLNPSCHNYMSNTSRVTIMFVLHTGSGGHERFSSPKVCVKRSFTVTSLVIKVLAISGLARVLIIHDS